MKVEVLNPDGKCAAMLEAMAAACPFPVVRSTEYQGGANLLMVYALGRSERRKVVEDHVAKGGRFVVWDKAYWGRGEKFRVSVDGAHPTRAQVAMAPTRGREIPPLQSLGNTAGPVLLCGTLSKSGNPRSANGKWELAMWGQLQSRWPGRIQYRPKPGRPGLFPGDAVGTIEDALRDVSLVVARQSNVGVDAAICGVPAVVDGGIASAFWPSKLVRRERSEDERRDFLGRVAWFQWRPDEARQAWDFLTTLIR